MQDVSFFTKIIRTKTLCLNSECPQASTCRRFIYAHSIPKDELSFSVFNPTYLSGLSECPHYWSTDLVHYAQGFIHLLEALPAGDKTLVNALMLRYGRKNYYRYRKGELLLPPEEQEFITDLVRQTCPSIQTVEFDGYVEQ